MGKVYTFVNQKGGVGKTTSAINLGAYLGIYGQRVLIVDLDPQANATSCLNIDRQIIQGGTYEVIIGASPAEAFILHNPKLKISILPSTPQLAGAEIELVSEIGRESKLKTALKNLIER
ncbi:MAG: ParA family protein, partial [Anaerolineales bacterium]